MSGRDFSRWVVESVCVVAIAAGISATAGAAQSNKACALLTPAEVKAAIGGKVSGWSDGGAVGAGGGSAVFLCRGQTPTASILLRLAKTSGRASGSAAAGIEIAKKMGAKVDVKTSGPITCSTVIPPENLAQYGFNTTCSIVKNGMVAAIEVQTKMQKDMVPIEKLQPLAEKMASRF